MATLLVSPNGFANEARTKKDLTQVQQQLKKDKQAYKKQKITLDKLQKGLKKAEAAIASSTRKLRKINKQVASNQAQQQALNTKVNTLLESKKQLNKLLAAQLKSAYMIGGSDYSKLLLNQQNTAKLERTISYYDYFNKARLAQLEKLKLTLIEIDKTQQELKANGEKLAKLQQQQQQQQQQLLSAKQARKKDVDKLAKQVSKLKGSINYLRDNEKTLVSTLTELEQTKKKLVNLIGLQRSKGKLRWPSQGTLKHRFGTRKHGSFKWKGIVLNANEGSSVNSIHNGQVVYADWLKGFGWVIVVDHGKGFMSLYGHAQALLKEVGERVRRGETIALVGQSGGQTSPSLYFEIRHKGQAVNPIKWLKKR